MPSVQFKKGGQSTRRLCKIKEAKDDFWERWMKKIVLTLLKQSKWIKLKRDITERDIVLRKD